MFCFQERVYLGGGTAPSKETACALVSYNLSEMILDLTVADASLKSSRKSMALLRSSSMLLTIMLYLTHRPHNRRQEPTTRGKIYGGSKEH
jgi:hypothetical protein